MGSHSGIPVSSGTSGRAAYRNALLEYTRERVPLDWATIRDNLGAALATLGGREAGTARLEGAVVIPETKCEWPEAICERSLI
jgi:hypothetical protein